MEAFHAFLITHPFKVSLRKLIYANYEGHNISIQTSLQQDTLMFVSILAHRVLSFHPGILDRILFCRVVNSDTGSRE